MRDIYSDKQPSTEYDFCKESVQQAIKKQISVDFNFHVNYKNEAYNYYAQAFPYDNNSALVYIRNIVSSFGGIDQQELINTIIDCLPIGVSVKDANNKFNYLYWNRYMEMMTGVYSDDIKGKSDDTINYSALISAEKRSEMDKQLVETGKMMEYSGRIKNALGKSMDIEVTKFPLSLKDGRPLVLTLWRDITQKLETDNLLKRTRLLSKMALQASGVDTCLVFVDPTQAPDFNNSYLQVNGWSTEHEELNVISMNTFLHSLYPSDVYPFMDKFRSMCLGEVQRAKIEVRTKFGRDDDYLWRELLANVQECDEEGRPTLLLCCSINIEARKGQEISLSAAKMKAEKADQMKSKYLANMSHEIRTPLSAITGFSELMAFAESDEERLSYYEIIKTNNNLLMQLINDILDLSKIEADMIQINYAPAEINELMLNVYASARLRMPDGVELVLEKGADSCIFGVDSIRLMQLINNLVNNSIKNTSKGQIVMGYEMLPDQRLKFYVSDTGIGIAHDKLKSLFTRFVKINDYMEGIGLGLAICNGLVTKMGGYITAESELGQGSTFFFVLPSHE
ncbi:MAG: ATP-binding protein [Tannerellaceae bacterium]